MTGRIEYEPIEAYHADVDHVSNSGLWLFNQSPMAYYEQIETRERERKVTAAMKCGNLVHTAILEPDRLAVEYAVEPNWNELICKEDGSPYANVKATKAYKEAHADWLERHATCTPITAAELATAQAMHDAVLRCPLASDILNACDLHEASVRWMDPNGALCRCRPDARGVWEGAPIVIDLKTADDPMPSGWVRKGLRYGYHQQAAFYLDGLASTCEPADRFLFIVVGSSEPHEVCVYEATPSYIQDGRDSYRRALAGLDAARSLDNWNHRYYNQIIPLHGSEI